MNLQTALDLLSEGDFPSAHQVFEHLLQQTPTSREYQTGFYFSGWWNNRTEILRKKSKGTTLASYLLEQWNISKKIAEERESAQTQSFQIITLFILRQAAKNYYVGSQQESAVSLPGQIVLDLGYNLLKLNSPKEAYQILLLVRKSMIQGKLKNKVDFFLGETLCFSQDPVKVDRGINMIRNALLQNPLAVKIDWFLSVFTKKLYHELQQLYNNDLDPCYWFPARFQIEAFAYPLRALSEKEFQYLVAEIHRLNIQKIAKQYQERTNAILCFYILNIIYDYHYYQKKPMEKEKYQRLFFSIAPEYYQKRMTEQQLAES